MGKDASQALGAPEVAGTLVIPKGQVKKLAAFGLAGAAVSEAMKKRSAGEGGGGSHELPHFGRSAYLAVADNEVALVKTKSGLLSLKPKITDEVLTRVPRTDVASVDLDKGMTASRLKLTFTDGATWELDVPKVSTKSGEKVAQALGGTVH